MLTIVHYRNPPSAASFGAEVLVMDTYVDPVYSLFDHGISFDPSAMGLVLVFPSACSPEPNFMWFECLSCDDGDRDSELNSSTH